SLARTPLGQPADAPHARSAQQDPRVQGVGLPHRKGGAASRSRRLAPRRNGVARLMDGYEFFIDPSRCIGCRACVAACAECDTHRGVSMIHVDYLDRANSIATTPLVCT